MGVAEEIFRQGILQVRPEDVRRGLVMGAKYAQPLKGVEDTSNPLVIFLTQQSVWLGKGLEAVIAPEIIDQERRATADIVDLLLVQSQNFEKIKKGRNLADQVLGRLTGEFEDVSNHAQVVIAAFHDSLIHERTPYRPNLESLFRSVTGQTRDERYRALKEIMTTVGVYLRDPQTQREKHMELHFKKEVREWLSVTALPPIEELPGGHSATFTTAVRYEAPVRRISVPVRKGWAGEEVRPKSYG